MTSHNKDNPSYRESTSEEYSALFSRVESAFRPEEMTRGRLVSWLNNETLADLFATTKEINDRINESESIEELREIRKDAKRLYIHRNEILRRLEEKIISISITSVEKFAEERKIKLSEIVKGNVENWKGKKVFVIRKHGHFVAWKKIK